MATAETPGWIESNDDTTVVWQDTPTHWQIAGPLAVGVGVFALGGYGAMTFDGVLRILSTGAIAVALLWCCLIVVRHRQHVYLMTQTELYKRSGLFSRTIETLSLTSVQNTTYSQSPLQRLLNVGSVEVETAGSDETELVLEEVPRPAYVANLVIDHSDGG